jgi:hypothetical protein
MKFTIARERQPDRQQHDDLVGEDREAQRAMTAHEDGDRNEHADQAAEEAHPAVPNRDDVEQAERHVAEVERRVVFGDDVGDDEERRGRRSGRRQRVDEEILDLLDAQAQAAPAGRASHPKPHADEPDEVREPVPADRYGAEVDRDRVDVRIREPVLHG